MYYTEDEYRKARSWAADILRRAALVYGDRWPAIKEKAHYVMLPGAVLRTTEEDFWAACDIAAMWSEAESTEPPAPDGGTTS